MLLAGSNYAGLRKHTEHQVSRECLHPVGCPLRCLPGLKLDNLAPHELSDVLGNCWKGSLFALGRGRLSRGMATNRLCCS
jgi:hypothetical protein